MGNIKVNILQFYDALKWKQKEFGDEIQEAWIEIPDGEILLNDEIEWED